VCDFATVARASVGIVDEILQNDETKLQCRQQVAADLSSVDTEIWQREVVSASRLLTAEAR
jgi:hypothetical protein